jgi:hypothetical protein
VVAVAALVRITRSCSTQLLVASDLKPTTWAIFASITSEPLQMTVVVTDEFLVQLPAVTVYPPSIVTSLGMFTMPVSVIVPLDTRMYLRLPSWEIAKLIVA